MRWVARAHFGSPFWEGHDFTLCAGPRWWCNFRARVWLTFHPYSRVRISPDDAGKVRMEVAQ